MLALLACALLASLAAPQAYAACNVWVLQTGDNSQTSCKKVHERQIGWPQTGVQTLTTCANKCSGQNACDSECSTRDGVFGCYCGFEVKFASLTKGYRTWDWAHHNYEGHCEHTLLKQCSSTNTFPGFELSQTNKVIAGSVFPDVFSLYVSEWDTTVEMLQNGIKVNNELVDASELPEVKTFDGAYRGYIKFDKIGYYWIVTTSFGIQIRRQGTYIFVTIPQHPDMMENTCGVLGTYDNDQTNDCTGSDGIAYSCSSASGVSAFGNSWCL